MFKTMGDLYTGYAFWLLFDKFPCQRQLTLQVSSLIVLLYDIVRAKKTCASAVNNYINAVHKKNQTASLLQYCKKTRLTYLIKNLVPTLC